MKEDFLHYLWKFKKFQINNLKTTNGETLAVINSGQYLQLAGPDFFNAQLIIGGQKWAGNVEIHLKSSDWYIHHHELDAAYENVILHVVWENDTAIFRQNNAEIPSLELKNYIATTILDSYNYLIRPKSWIYCEKELASIPVFILKNWQERLYFERLERKSNPIFELTIATKSDWEAVLFCLLAKNFGLNTNGEIFFKIAQDIPFSVIRKESFEIQNLEALLFGTAGLLDAEKEDTYFSDLKLRYYYLRQKYKFTNDTVEPLQFFKHRPDNFPTIRLSQLANLYVKHRHLFSKIIAAQTIEMIYEIFDVAVSEYWQSHYQFDRESSKKKKTLTKSFIDLIIINTIIPLRFAYSKSLGKEIDENVLSILNKIAPETNAIIDKFFAYGITAENAFESQALLQLKNEYCNKNRCLECAIGMELLKT
ncbi:MAG: DUF2851 family protein [Flavobacterium sp.]|nr:DUF2851 family protein [Flavobacterium sp.]